MEKLQPVVVREKAMASATLTAAETKREGESQVPRQSRAEMNKMVKDLFEKKRSLKK
jgi:hypothetical protein